MYGLSKFQCRGKKGEPKMPKFNLNIFRNVGDVFWRKWIFFPDGAYRGRLAKLKHELQIEKRANEDGRNNTPATSDLEPSGVERLIDHRFVTNADAIKQAHWRGLTGALDRIAKCIPQKLEPKAVADAVELAIVRIRDRARPKLIARRKRERDCSRNLKGFQSANGLKHRSASYSLPWPMKLLFWVTLAIAIDAILNGAFFAERNPEYWRGGVTQALAFSVVNVLLGYVLLGLIAARYAGHIVVWKRIAGVACVIFAVVAGIVWNCYVGHYRELLEQVPLDHIDALAKGSYVDALSHMRDHPFALASWQAIVLLFIGFAIFISMAVKGYHGDDVYPRYGHHDRTHKAALRDYESEKAVVKKAIEQEIDRTTKMLRNRLKSEARKVEEARKIVSQSDALHREMVDSAADVARACTAAVQCYRETNTFVRTTPPPEHFKSLPAFTVDLTPMPEIAERYQQAVDALEQNRLTANEIEEHLNEVGKKVLGEFLGYVDDIENHVANENSDVNFPHAAE
jgi:hypothetical protein